MNSREDLKHLYGKEYVEAFEHQNRFRLSRLLKYIYLENTHSVADFACGNGMLMELVAPHVGSYVGVDFCEEFVEAGNAKRERLVIPNAAFECADIVEFCRRHPHAFDVAFAMDFSEHVYDAEWVNILRAIRDSLKPQGRLYLHTPNAEFFLERMKGNGILIKQFPEHVAVRTPAENTRILGQAGFSIVQVSYLAHYNPILRMIHPLSFCPVFGKYFKARLLVESIA